MIVKRDLPPDALPRKDRELGAYSDCYTTDDEARRLSRGALDAFAAWTVDARARDQVLLVDFMRRTKSWLMVAALDETHTRLYFGTVIVPVRKSVLLAAASAKLTNSSR